MNGAMNGTLFINISNHPSAGWSEEQREAAIALATARDDDGEIIAEGKIVDIPFPSVDPAARWQQVYKLAQKLREQIFSVINENVPAEVRNNPEYPPVTIHLMGEQSLCWILPHLLPFRFVVSTTERVVVDGRPQFKFVRFRRLPYADEELSPTSPFRLWH